MITIKKSDWYDLCSLNNLHIIREIIYQIHNDLKKIARTHGFSIGDHYHTIDVYDVRYIVVITNLNRIIITTYECIYPSRFWIPRTTEFQAYEFYLNDPKCFENIATTLAMDARGFNNPIGEY